MANAMYGFESIKKVALLCAVIPQEVNSESFKQDKTGDAVVLDERTSSRCGYTISRDIFGNVEIRISFMGCWIENLNDVQFNLTVQFLVRSPRGVLTKYPVFLSCDLKQPWSVREVICEENYMEVSVRRIVPLTEDWTSKVHQLGWPVAQDGISRWRVEFNMLDRSPLKISAQEAINKGYGLNATATRVVFRAPYNTSESRIIKDGNHDLEVIEGCMYYAQPLVRLIVDTTTACPIDSPIFSTSTLSWMSPAVLSPLVLDLSTYQVLNLDMGLNGQVVDQKAKITNRYILTNDSKAVAITVPIGAHGGYTESDIVNNTYGTIYRIHLLLVRNWRGAAADTTRHTAFKRITTPFRAELPIFIDRTIPERKYFDLSLGNFFPDVDLKSFVINKVNVTLEEANRRGFRVITVANDNDTTAYVLQVPFSDPLVEQKYLYDRTNQYTLYFTYVMTLLTKNKDFTYSDVVRVKLEDAIPPSYLHSCEKRSLVLLVKRGNMDERWIRYIRNLPLTDKLAKSQNYGMFENSSIFRLEVPFPAVGLVYEETKLKGTRARLDFSLRDESTLEVKSDHSFECTFPPNTICFPNGTVVATVNGSHTKPRFDPRETHLRDPTCKPQEANDDLALFSFSVYTCGTTRQFDSDYLVYENEITFDLKGLPSRKPIISRNSTYRQTVRCRYPLQDSQRLYGKYNKTRYPLRRFSALSTGNNAKVVRRSRNAQAAELRVAKDYSFSSFYLAGEFPVSLLRAEGLYLQADGRSNSSQAKLQECWATNTPQADGSPQWDLIVDGCAKKGVAVSTVMQNAEDSPSRFQVTIEGDLGKQFYVHCRVLLCDPDLEAGCKTTCIQKEQGLERRELPQVQKYEFVSAGPFQVYTTDVGIRYEHVGQKTWSAWTWVLALGLGLIAAFTVGLVILAVRLFVH
ncbi:uncharacterized protein WCC33_006672 [Rhinophrynus dorsalis]